MKFARVEMEKTVLYILFSLADPILQETLLSVKLVL